MLGKFLPSGRNRLLQSLKVHIIEHRAMHNRACRQSIAGIARHLAVAYQYIVMFRLGGIEP